MENIPKIKTDDVLTLFIAIDLLLNNKQIYPELLTPLGMSYQNIQEYLITRGLINTSKEEKNDLVLIED